MKTRLFLFTLAAAAALATSASAGCYADYKAKRENPLQLHYGVMQIDSDPCTMSDKVTGQAAKRLAANGWTLLKIGSVFDDSGLAKRKRDAGQYFLRF